MGARRPKVSNACARLGRWKWLAMRCVWLGLAAVHVWPLVTVLIRFSRDPSLDLVASLVSLLAVFAVFTLKCIDLSVLRTDRPKLELVAWILCAALVHQGPVRDLPVSDAAATVTPAVLAVGVTAAARKLRRLVRAFSRLVGSFRCSLAVSIIAPIVVRYADVPLSRTLYLRRTLSGCAARGPPLLG